MEINYKLVCYCLIIILSGTHSTLADFGFPTNDGILSNIPPSLLDCYNSSYITTRDNLLPMTVNTLIALVRKIEETVGTNMDVRTMSSALLTSYRYDGIRYEPELDPQGIPYAVKDNEFALWKLLYDQIIAKTGFTVPNDTLTWVEKCTLHRMLSMSIDPFDRGDGDAPCSRLNRFQTWSNRYPRDVSKLSDVEMITPKAKGESRIINEDSNDQQHSGNFMQVLSSSGFPKSSCPIENGVIRDPYSGTLAAGIVIAGIATGSQPQSVPPRNLYFMQPRVGSGLRRKNYPSDPGNSMYPNNPNFKPNINAYGNPYSGGPQRRTFFANQYGTNIDDPYGGNGPYNPNMGGGGSIPNNPSGGRGIGGSGMPPMGGGGMPPMGGGGMPPMGGGNPGYNGYDPYNSKGTEDLPIPSPINNIHAATLAGELARVAIWMGPVIGGMQIGLDGGWNDTLVPKYYFQKQFIDGVLSDPMIRGSIDGLLLARNMENWVSSSRGILKVSQLLSMYYSGKGVFSTTVKACKRREFYDQIAPINDIKDQTYSAAYGLVRLSPYVIPQLPQFTSVASDAVRSYIPTLQDPACPLDTSNTPKPASVVDLYIVLDFNWINSDFRYISQLLQYMVDNLELWKYGGNFTIINAKDASLAINSSHSPLDLFQNLTSYLSYSSYSNVGFDFTKVLSQLKIIFQDKLEYDRQQFSGGGIPRVVLFMPASSVAMSEAEKYNAKNRIQFFKGNLPDVRFLYLVTGNKNNFSPFTDNPDKDIFVITRGSDIPSSLSQLMSTITTTPRRIINPNCGKFWRGNWYNEAQLNGYLDFGEIHYYRIHPNYFFRGANAKITVSSEGNTPVLTLCYSRDNPMPIANLSRTGSVTCNQITYGSRLDMYIKEADCSSVYYAFECKPLYFSIANLQTPPKTLISISCTDTECRDPDMTKYVIRHVGLSCYSSVPKLVVSVPVLLITLFLQLSKIL